MRKNNKYTLSYGFNCRTFEWKCEIEIEFHENRLHSVTADGQFHNNQSSLSL